MSSPPKAHPKGSRPVGPQEPSLRDRNLVLLSERLEWPEGALAVVFRLEALYPDYAIHWGIGRVTDPKPGFYARMRDGYWQSPIFYATAATDLSDALARDKALRDAAQQRGRWARP